MDRHNSRHLKSRVELPLSVRSARVTTLLGLSRVSPAVTSLVGLMSFMTGGVAVVVTASLLALQIN